MPESVRCPDCGTVNAPGAVSCAQCNFPLAQESRSAAPAGGEAAAGTAESRPFDPGPRPVLRRRPRPNAMEPVQMQLWLITGVAVVLGIVYFAFQGFSKSNAPPIAGARPEQQQQADLARQAIEKDSTNAGARIALADILYDTGNWSDAIVHYRSAARLDPRRATTLVDLGVCYYNLSAFGTAESLFTQALALDPRQPMALFNLGVVAETRGRYDEALDFFRRAQVANPPPVMQKPLLQHMHDVMAKLQSPGPAAPR